MDKLTVDASTQLGALFGTQSEMVFGFILLRCGSRPLAEDIMAETFASAGRLFTSGRGSEVTPSWLRTVARRRLIDHWRHLASSRRGIEKLTTAVKRSVPHDSDPDGLVQTALDSLPDRQRAVLVLRYLDDFAVSEVAEAIGASYKATESLLARARSAFSQAYEGEISG